MAPRESTSGKSGRATRYVALLRAVNLPGHGVIAMPRLTAALGDLGLQDVRTLLQSGNVVFQTEKRPAATLERLLEDHAVKNLGLDTAFFVRTAAEIDKIIAANPFPDEAERDPSHLVVMFLKRPADSAAVKRLQAAISGTEVVRGQGAQVYIIYPDGIGRSKLTNKVIEAKLGTPVTGRNWNTVLKLAALVEP